MTTEPRNLNPNPTEPRNLHPNPTGAAPATMEVRKTISPYDLTSGTSYANAVQVKQPGEYEQANYVVTDADRDGVIGLSDSQWKAIKNLLNAGKAHETEKLTSKSPFPLWIMDTGASHHLTGRLDILTDVKDMQPVGIVLADGRERVSVKEGSVRLGPNLILRSVYYVEDFHTNLISLCQLMDENHCVMQLADRFLVVQDRTTRMVHYEDGDWS